MAKGISTQGDVLVNELADGTDLNEVWSEIQQALELYNRERTAIVRLLSYPTTKVADVVPQSISSESFEEATEMGLPRAVRPPTDVLRLGYSFKDFDLRWEATWKFLRSATAEQVTAQTTRIIEADNKNVTTSILRRLFDPTIYYNDWNHKCYGLWTGIDDPAQTPPPYLGKTFTPDHTHYLVSGSNVLDSLDIEIMLNHVAEHGYSAAPGTQMLIFVHPDDVKSSRMTAWRAGVEYAVGAPLPDHDFIPSALMPAWISDETIHGRVPASDWHGLEVWGSYANALLIQSQFLPEGYVAVVASGGPDSEHNPVAVREFDKPQYRGRRLVRGPHQGYPLQDIIFARGFGTGVRHRGAAVVMQIKDTGSYTVPEFPK